MLKMLAWALSGVAVIMAGAFVFMIARGDGPYGITHLWDRLFGPPDLGAVDFTGIVRRASGNDALFCPPGYCGASRVDGVSPAFDVPVARLRDTIRVIEVNDPNLELAARDQARGEERYLARTPIMRYPDTINVRYIDLGGARSSVALYSRSQIGRSDFGVNRARLENWITTLKAALPLVQP